MTNKINPDVLLTLTKEEESETRRWRDLIEYMLNGLLSSDEANIDTNEQRGLRNRGLGGEVCPFADEEIKMAISEQKKKVQA